MNTEKRRADLNNIPEYMKDLNQWICYMANEDGSVNKKPFSLTDYKPGIKMYDYDRLATFIEAEKAMREERVAAIGLCMNSESDLIVFDVDDHNSEKHEKYKELKELILQEFDGYAETSISGSGLHLIIKARDLTGYKNRCRYDIIDKFSTNHTIMVTGDILPDRTNEIIEQQEKATAFIENYFKKHEDVRHFIEQNQADVRDSDVLDKIRKNMKGRHFLSGDWDKVLKEVDGVMIQRYPSQSEADYAFIMLILYYNGNNLSQAEELFIGSKMHNNERIKKKSVGYVKSIINSSAIRISKTYDWKRAKKDQFEDEADFDELIFNASEDKVKETIQKYGLEWFGDKELNKYIEKYVMNYGLKVKNVVDTRLGDYDAASNGQRFFLINKDDLIYDNRNREWLSWDSSKWNRLYERDMLDRAERVFHSLKHEAYRMVYGILNELDEDKRQRVGEEAYELFKYASTNKHKKTCLDMIDFAKSHFIKDNPNFTMNDDINVINLQNGVYDFDKLELVNHDKKYYQTRVSPVVYDKNAICPEWEKFLSTVLPKTDIRQYLQKVIGYTFSAYNNEKMLLVYYGKGNNGKTTLVNTCRAMMAEYGTGVAPATIIDSAKNKQNGARPDLLNMRDRRLLMVSEFEQNAPLSEALIKNITGMGYVSCRDLHKSIVEFKATGKMWIDTNHRPVISGGDAAIWQRIKLIPFDIRIPNDRIDTQLPEKLTAELSGIFNWVIEGYRLYKQEGLIEPEEVKMVVNEYKNDMTAFKSWWNDCIDVVAHKGTTAKELYRSYRHWSMFSGEKDIWSQRKFSREINQINESQSSKKVNGIVKYLDIQLNDLGNYCGTTDPLKSIIFAEGFHRIIDQNFDRSENKKISKDKVVKLKTSKENNPISIFGGGMVANVYEVNE